MYISPKLIVFVLSICLMSQAVADEAAVSQIALAFQQALDDIKLVPSLDSDTVQAIDKAKADLQGADLQRIKTVFARVSSAISQDPNVPQVHKDSLKGIAKSLDALGNGSNNSKYKLVYLLPSFVVSVLVLFL